MNARLALIFVVLLAILGGGALLYYQKETARRPENVSTLGRNLFKDLKAADIAAIRMVEPQATLTVQRKDERWVLAERDGFPADVAKVREFVLQVLALKVGQSEPIGDQDRARLNLDQSGTQVEFAAADGKALGRLIVGKKYFKREVDNPEKARADGRFVALPADLKTVYLVSDPLTQATAKSSEWIDRGSFQVEKVKTLELRYPEGGGWRIERDADNSDWRLAAAKPGEKLDASRANAASYSLSMLELADVAPKDAKDTGLDNPVAIEATTLDGLAYSIKVGKLVQDNYYVTFSSSGTPAKNDKDAERLKKLEERLPREKLLSEYLLLIPKGKLEDTLKKRAELLEKKEDAKKR
ncbi:MAG: DUF4340 domain-containing protein [Betaproteobacteria bacterium]|nr:MAG: DUF4340 domain-containing protein [Betaproteobacteria bacterium]